MTNLAFLYSENPLKVKDFLAMLENILPDVNIVKLDFLNLVDNKGNTPITMFMARDHHINNYLFERVVENSKLVVSIIGVRFELNDSSICCIGKLNEVESVDLS